MTTSKKIGSGRATRRMTWLVSAVVAAAFGCAAPLAASAQFDQFVGPSEPQTKAPANGITAVAVDRQHDLYVAYDGRGSIEEVPAGCTQRSCIRKVGAGLNNPTDVKVDDRGNVFVADYGNGAVKEIPAACTSAACTRTLGGGFKRPVHIALDRQGSVDVVDDVGDVVSRIPRDCANAGCVKTLVSGRDMSMFHPAGIAANAKGTLYLASGDNMNVYVIPAGCADPKCVRNVGPGAGIEFMFPKAVAADDAGNLFVTTSGPKAGIVEVPVDCARQSCTRTLFTGLAAPISIALDGTDRMYVADSANNWTLVIPKGCAQVTCTQNIQL